MQDVVRKVRWLLTVVVALTLAIVALPMAQPAQAADEIPANWTNIAQNAVVRASSELNDSRANYAVDGIADDDTNRWRTNSKAELHWLDIYFNGPHNIVGATFETGYSKPEWALKNMRLEAWDGQQWVTIPGIDISGNTNISVTLKATTPVRTNVVRFASDDGTRGLRVREIMVYTDDAITPLVPTEPADSPAPTLSHTPGVYSFPVQTPYRMEFTSSKELANAQVYVRDDTAADPDQAMRVYPLELALSQDGNSLYAGNVQFAGIGANSYTIVAIDKAGNVVKVPTNGTYSIVGRAVEPVRPAPTRGFSLRDGQSIGGTVPVYAFNANSDAAAAGTMRLDGVPLKTVRSLPLDATFKFQGRSIDVIYQSAITGTDANGKLGELGGIDNPVDSWYVNPVGADYLTENAQTVTIHTGNENVYYTLENHDTYFGKSNFDDFYVKNMHLELADFSVIHPSELVLYTGGREVKTVPYEEDKEYLLADDGPPTHVATIYPMMIDVRFNIPARDLTAAYTTLDTTAFKDGVHTLSWEVNGATQQVQVVIDNDPPVVTDMLWQPGTSLNDGDTVKGTAEFNVTTDDTAETVEAWIDDTPVKLPYSVSSLDLTQGAHSFRVRVSDAAGNTTEQQREFLIGTERPTLNGTISPVEGAQDVPRDTALSAVVTDPNGDDVTATFYAGQRFDAATTPDRIQVFSNTSDREPPVEAAPAGETALDDAARALIATPDDETETIDGTTGFPYHRFAVNVGTQTVGTQAQVIWRGTSLPGRVVTLYAWNVTTSKWDAIASHVPEAEDESFELAADVDLATYAQDGQIQALVQDQVLTDSDEFTLLWSTDTQFYAKQYPDYFDKLYSWIVDDYKQGGFEYMIHTGDVVDNAKDANQWAVADRNFDRLDEAGVPYGVLAGNHDVVVDGRVDYTNFGAHYGDERVAGKPWFGGSLDNNRNHYDLVSFGGQDFLVMYLGWGTENAADTEAWANRVLKQYSDRNAILNLHAYLENTGTLSRMSQRVYDNIVVPNENVKLVLSGHYHAATHNVKQLKNADGSDRTLVEILFDYQEGPNGGDGFIRMLDFDPAKNELSVKTYSPILDKFNAFSAAVDDFTVPFEFMPTAKRVATDYFAVNVFTDTQIGEPQQVKSGENAAIMPTTPFAANSLVTWYVRAVDIDGAATRGPLHTFTTGEQLSEQPGVTEPSVTEPSVTEPSVTAPGVTQEPDQPELPSDSAMPTSPTGSTPTASDAPKASKHPSTQPDAPTATPVDAGALAHTGASGTDITLLALAGGILLAAGVTLHLRARRG